MSFRASLCRWCPKRDESLEGCRACPRFKKYTSGDEAPLTSQDFCTVCLHGDDETLKVFCTRNRYYQQDSDEDFDCYQFRLSAVENA
ncbi:MAG: hypothetical protein ABFD81_12660 [Syntrophaceae bacterium]